MRFPILILMILTLSLCSLHSLEVTVKNDNGEPGDHSYSSGRYFWEESAILHPDGPCDVNKIMVYLSGDTPVKDTLWIMGYPTAGNLYPTQYVWHYNFLIEPIPYDYDGTPGWKEFDVSGTGLRSDGYDKIVIQHRMKPDGPWFTFDDDGRDASTYSWMTDPFTPNSNFLNIIGTIYAYPGGDYMVRLLVEYDYPDGEGSEGPPPPSLVKVNDLVGIRTGGHPSVVDWNNDGWDDIELGGQYFQNKGNGSYENMTEQFGITSGNTAWGDFNNDGNIDVFVAKGWTNDKLFRNNGDGTFTDVTEGSNIINDHPTMTPVWFDYNGDALLDLFLANNRSGSWPNEIYHPDKLFRNDGDGVFTEVSNESGIEAGEPGGYDCYGAAASDYNMDNLIDIFVANYRLAKDNLYKNNGDGTFTEVAAQTGVQGEPTQSPQYFGHGMGCEWGDFNNDGLSDLIVGNLGHPDSRGAVSNPSLIYENQGGPDYNFAEVHNRMGLKFHEGNAGACWLDLDLDGWLDLWHGKYSGGIGSFYINQGPPDYKLREETWKFGAIVDNPWVAVRLDYDHDGDLDIIENGHMYRNDIPRKGNWLAVRLSGDPTDGVSMDAYGSKVFVYAGDKMFTRELAGSAAGSRCTQNSNEIHFGLGNIDDIDSLVVYYQNGKSYAYTDLETNMRYRLPYFAEHEVLTTVPALKYPENYAFGLDQDLYLEFYPVKGISEYTIQITNSTFDLVYNHTITITDEEWDSPVRINDVRLNCGTYTWRVYHSEANRYYSSKWEFSVCYPIPNRISLVTPENMESEVTVKPTFSWTEPGYDASYGFNTKYDLQISTDEEFNEINFEYSDLKELQYTPEDALDPGTTYYWRARATNYEQPGDWSDTWQFTTLPLPDAPIQTEPEDKAFDVSTKPRLKWETNETSKNYEVAIALDSEFQNVVFQRDNILLGSAKPMDRLEYETEYFWHVRGINEGGAGPWSDTWSFTTEVDTGIEEMPDDNDEDLRNIPNPFNGKTEIVFTISDFEVVKLSVYDESGRHIETILNDMLLPGTHTIEWRPKNIPAGVYYYQLETKDNSRTGKLIYAGD